MQIFNLLYLAKSCRSFRTKFTAFLAERTTSSSSSTKSRSLAKFKLRKKSFCRHLIISKILLWYRLVGRNNSYLGELLVVASCEHFLPTALFGKLAKFSAGSSERTSFCTFLKSSNTTGSSSSIAANFATFRKCRRTTFAASFITCCTAYISDKKACFCY